MKCSSVCKKSCVMSSGALNHNPDSYYNNNNLLYFTESFIQTDAAQSALHLKSLKKDLTSSGKFVLKVEMRT